MKRMRFALLLAFALTLLVTQIASAHEKRTVGKYDLLVGWTNEPAYVNLANAISLTVTETQSGKPVTALVSTLQAEVIFGARSMVVALTESDENPGTYTGTFIPTKVGTYIFHYSGQIGAQAIDEKFESGPNTFDDVQDTAPVQFPDKVPSPQELAGQILVAQDAARSAQTLAHVGIGAGVLGLIVGGLALMRRK